MVATSSKHLVRGHRAEEERGSGNLVSGELPL
jgi:hypothetical protein